MGWPFCRNSGPLLILAFSGQVVELMAWSITASSREPNPGTASSGFGSKETDRRRDLELGVEVAL